MGLRRWVGQDMQSCSEDRYWGAGESRGHALHQSLHLQRAVSQLPVFPGDAESSAKASQDPLQRPPLERLRGGGGGTPGVEALKTQRQICEVGQVESHTWD